MLEKHCWSSNWLNDPKCSVVGFMTTIRSTIGLTTELLMREKDAIPFFSVT